MASTRTGLVLDPYFSATKIHWLLEQDASLRARAESGKLAWGTIDSFLIWRLTGGRVHATDVTNASRTLLFNLQTVAWDEELCRFFGVPTSLLADVRPSAADFGTTCGLGFLPDGLPITGVAGDQQAAQPRRRHLQPITARQAAACHVSHVRPFHDANATTSYGGQQAAQRSTRVTPGHLSPAIRVDSTQTGTELPWRLARSRRILRSRR